MFGNCSLPAAAGAPAEGQEAEASEEGSDDGTEAAKPAIPARVSQQQLRSAIAELAQVKLLS